MTSRAMRRRGGVASVVRLPMLRLSLGPSRIPTWSERDAVRFSPCHDMTLSRKEVVMSLVHVFISDVSSNPNIPSLSSLPNPLPHEAHTPPHARMNASLSLSKLIRRSRILNRNLNLTLLQLFPINPHTRPHHIPSHHTPHTSRRARQHNVTRVQR